MATIYNPQDDFMQAEYPFQTQYIAALVKDTDYVLCCSSAAEYLGLCNCSLNDKVYAYKEEDCINQAIRYDQKNGVKYTTINQTINDLLSDHNIDEQVVIEALAEIYYDVSGKKFDVLAINPENQEAFHYFGPMAASYYNS